MSETDSFIQEVTEEVRQDRMFALWKKWGPFILIGVALIVGGAAAWNWMQAEERRAAEELGAAFVDADPAKIAEEEALVALADGPARVLAELRLAAAMAESGDRAGAIERYEEVAGTAGLTPVYADLARLQALRLMAESDPAAALAGIDALTGDGAPYRLLALELGAALKLNTGDLAGAHADLNAIIADPAATEDSRLRAAALLSASGGEIEGASG